MKLLAIDTSEDACSAALCVGDEILERFEIPYRPDVMVNFGSNSVMTMGNSETVTENFLKKFGITHVQNVAIYVTVRGDINAHHRFRLIR